MYATGAKQASERKRKRWRYTHDPAYRATVVARHSRYAARKREEFPEEFKRLQYLHMRVHRLREQIDGHQRKVESKECELLRLLKERDSLKVLVGDKKSI
jgi:hypothetical protein